VLTIVDTYSRFSPALEPRFMFRSADVGQTGDRPRFVFCLCPDDWMMASGIDLWDEATRARIEAFQADLSLGLLRAGQNVVIERVFGPGKSGMPFAMLPGRSVRRWNYTISPPRRMSFGSGL
jgi:hypothetical protein